MNQAERYVNDVMGNTDIVLDLNAVFADGREIVLFGVCNMIYQQVCMTRLV